MSYLFTSFVRNGQLEIAKLRRNAHCVQDTRYFNSSTPAHTLNQHTNGCFTFLHAAKRMMHLIMSWSWNRFWWYSFAVQILMMDLEPSRKLLWKGCTDVGEPFLSRWVHHTESDAGECEMCWTVDSQPNQMEFSTLVNRIDASVWFPVNSVHYHCAEILEDCEFYRLNGLWQQRFQ